MANMSLDALKNHLSNPQMTFLWEIIIPAPIGGGEVEVYQLRAQSTQIPSRDQGQITIPFKQTAGVALPGKLAFTHKWECSFIEGEDKKVYDAIYGWMQSIVSVGTGTGAGDSSIKTDIYLTLLKRSGEVTLKLKLKGCYITSLGQTSLTYSDEKCIEYPVTWSFDSVEKMS